MMPSVEEILSFLRVSLSFKELNKNMAPLLPILTETSDSSLIGIYIIKLANTLTP
jgi:hypothetical protein